MALIDEFVQRFGIPSALQPYLDKVADEVEMRLVLGLQDQEMCSADIAEMVNMPRADTEALLARATYRAILNRRKTHDGLTVYSAADCWRRLTYLSVQENEWWGSLPSDVRESILEWHLWANIRHHGLVEKTELLKEQPDAATIHNRDILLLDEALAIVEAASLHVVVPCDCRTLVMHCHFSRWDTCLRLDDRGRWTLEAGEGRVVSKETCRQIVIDADRAGLMHTGQRAEDGRPAILNGNCCACCSYPFREGKALGMDRLWPRAHYVAQRDPARCDDCGLCATRCHFQAFSLDENGKIVFAADKCHGCGLCATGCPQEAIQMISLAKTPFPM